MKSVLFLCVANSARSQMAHGLAGRVFGDEVRAQSAGSRATSVNAFAVIVMDEIGIDISGHESKSVDTIDPASVDLVITLCAEEVCPVFLGDVERLHWPLEDPAFIGGELSRDAALDRFRSVRDEILGRLTALRDGS